MTLPADLIAISSVAVGASPAYPVVRQRIDTSFEGPDQQNTAAYRIERWELTCHAWAASDAAVATMSETIRTDLCRRGEVVTLTEWAGTRTLLAGGAAGGGEPGYPIVRLADEPERCFGTLLTFTLLIESRIPQPDGASLVEHDWERTEETDEEGKVRTTQRGTYRVANGENAQATAQTAVIDPAQAAATTANQTFRVRWTLGPDAALAVYEYIASDKQYTGDIGVTEAQLTDRTTRDNGGRVVRSISGYAAGSGAQAWVDLQAPVPDATNILVRRETSPATIPDGRINFTWELLTGVVDAQFPNIVLFGLAETIEENEQVEVLLASTYLGRDPVLRYGVLLPTTYTQRTRVDFMGTWANAEAAVTGLFDDANLVTVPRRRRDAGRHGLKTLEMTSLYMYPVPKTPKPEPREVPAIS